MEEYVKAFIESYKEKPHLIEYEIDNFDYLIPQEPLKKPEEQIKVKPFVEHTYCKTIEDVIEYRKENTFKDFDFKALNGYDLIKYITITEKENIFKAKDEIIKDNHEARRLRKEQKKQQKKEEKQKGKNKNLNQKVYK